MKLIRQLAILAGLFVFVLAFAQPAAAPKPELLFEDSGEVVDEVLEDCGDFLIIENSAFDVTGKLFFNGDGTPKYIRFQLNFDGTLTTSDGRKTAVIHAHQVEFFDPFTTFTTTFVGVPFHIVIKGEGSTVQDTGIIVFDLLSGFPPDILFQGGPHDFAEAGFFLDLCELMA